MKNFPFSIMIMLALFYCPLILADTPAPDELIDGLELVKKSWRGEVLLDSSADWSKYKNIQLERATVDFRKNWARDQRNRHGIRVTDKGMERIKSDLSELLNEVFTEELTKNGAYSMSSESGEDVMRITPSVVDLNVYAPDRMRDYIGYTLTDSQGSMTLKLEIHDSVSGALLARASDNQEDPQKGYLEWTTSGTNRRSARLMLMRWARGLLDWLEEAKSTGEPAGEVR